MDNNKFYDLISDNYDEMISFNKSLENKIVKFKSFITAEMKNAADCGCGTGVDSIALTKAGLNVTSFDLLVSLGNTFANADGNNFINSVKRCFEILKPGGTILIHILNYYKILEEKTG